MGLGICRLVCYRVSFHGCAGNNHKSDREKYICFWRNRNFSVSILFILRYNHGLIQSDFQVFSPSTRNTFNRLASLLTIYGAWNAYTIKVKEVIIPIKGLTQEIRAVHITDVHLGNFRGKREVDKIVRKIKELNPDVVFNTGDMFDSKAHFGEGKDVLSAFRTLNMPHNNFVYGNHDEHVGVEEVIRQMKKANA